MTKRPPLPAGHGRQGKQPPPAQISGRWLLRALLLSLLAAAACAYLSLCLLFYQGQWQIVFHPSRTITTTPATLGVPFDDVRFDATESGVLQLDGWWIPADPGSRNASATLLFFHDGRGSLSDSAAELKTLHSLGINLFAFDYRGFGLSADTHPSEERVDEDADAAWEYLTGTRHLVAGNIVLYGQGLGATIASEAANRHASAPGLILENPAPSGLTLIGADPRTHLLPVRLLFHDRFELEPKLRDLKTPKLFLDTASSPQSGLAHLAYAAAASPKSLVGVAASDPKFPESLRRFLDELLPLR